MRTISSRVSGIGQTVWELYVIHSCGKYPCCVVIAFVWLLVDMSMQTYTTVDDIADM